MGTFCEVVLAFRFREGTPGEVLAAFERWRAPDAPPLPPLGPLGLDAQDEVDELTEGLWDEAVAGLPVASYAHLLLGYVSEQGCASLPGRPGTVLAFERGWVLTTRFVAKCYLDEACALVGRLGSFAEPGGSDDRPRFVGFVHQDDGDVATVWDEGAAAFAFRAARDFVDPGDAATPDGDRPRPAATAAAPATHRDFAGLLRYLRHLGQQDGTADGPGMPTEELLASFHPAGETYADDTTADYLRENWDGTFGYVGLMAEHYFVLGPARYRAIVDAAFAGRDPQAHLFFVALAVELSEFSTR